MTFRLFQLSLHNGTLKKIPNVLMTISYRLEKRLLHLKIIWFYISSVLFIWACLCFQGDEARPVSVSHVSPITCHVIFEKALRRHVTKECSCKCWIWCKNTTKCLKWSLHIQSQLLLQQPSKREHILEILATACSSCCDRNFHPSSLYDSSPQMNFKCNGETRHPNSSYCDNHPEPNWCCSAFCSDDQNTGECFYLYPNASSPDYVTSSKYRKNTSTKDVPTQNTIMKNFSKRRKRSDNFELPYHIRVLDDLQDFTVHQPFDIRIQLMDEMGVIVPYSGRKVELKISNNESNFKRKKRPEIFGTFLENGKANFTNITFKESGSNYRLFVESRDVPEVLPWSSEKLTVNYRPLTLRASGRTLPISPRENDTLSPAAGVIIYDEMDAKPANKSYLAQYTWEASISFLYEGIYPGKLLGTTKKIITDGSNEILFDNIEISMWGYSYILKIQIKARETSNWNLTYLLGPFDVDKYDTFELPLVESDEFRKVKVVYDNDYKLVTKDKRKFEIFFLNQFGLKYSDVRWKNVTLSKGSIIVNAVITGLTSNLEKTSKLLEAAIEKGGADVIYENTKLKANKIFLPSRKLLEESGSSSESSSDGAGGLSVAWIVAIVVNVVLIVVFIIAIVYCYCRRKRQREISRSASTIREFDGGPNPLLFTNKGENQKSLQDKAAIFTIEDSKMGKHRSLSGKIHNDNDRCTCQSPTCYCSVGDGRKTEMTLQHSEENEDDPQGYPTPSPEPKFPTPEPTPEPEDFWRPDSEPPQEEEPEEEEMFLPGAVSEPSPEPPQEERFYVYLSTDLDGSRDLIGQLYLKLDSFLSETRRAIDRDRDLYDVIDGREYRFLDENLDIVPNYQESSLDLERVYPSLSINIQYIPPKTPTPSPQPVRPKLPAYVGPLGICGASDCTRAAKIKCLDCRNVAYCSKRCMREDAKDHKRVCYKPAWRL